MEAIVDRLLDRKITLAEYRGGKKDRQVIPVQDVDFVNYFWSGLILDYKAIFIMNDFLDLKSED